MGTSKATLEIARAVFTENLLQTVAGLESLQYKADPTSIERPCALKVWETLNSAGDRQFIEAIAHDWLNIPPTMLLMNMLALMRTGHLSVKHCANPQDVADELNRQIDLITKELKKDAATSDYTSEVN